MLGGLLALAAFGSWRKSGRAWRPLGGVAALSAGLALFAPPALAPVLSAWMRVARVVAAFNIFLLMALVYFLVFTPYGLYRRLAEADPLDLKLKTGPSYWHKREKERPREDYSKLF